jgi:hypothetical protein
MPIGSGNGWHARTPEEEYPQRSREALIAQALGTDAGREALAAAMIAPIRRSMDYQAVGRRLLMVDELPMGALERYQRDVRAVGEAIQRGQLTPGIVQETDQEPSPAVAASQHFYSPEPAFGDDSRWDEI